MERQIIFSLILCASFIVKADDSVHISPPLSWGFITGKDFFTENGQAYKVKNGVEVESCLNEYNPRLKEKIKTEVNTLGTLAKMPIKGVIQLLGGYEKITLVSALKNSRARGLLDLSLITGKTALSKERALRGYVSDIVTEKPEKSLESHKYYVIFNGVKGLRKPTTSKVLNCPIHIGPVALSCKTK
jgi:hypothetical protein